MNTLVAMVAALSALSPLAGAEEVESESSSEPRMREVSVTATRTERAVDDVPATVTAIDSRQMERDITAEASRVETLLAALLYLMTAYQRTGCRRIAACRAPRLRRRPSRGRCHHPRGVCRHAQSVVEHRTRTGAGTRPRTAA